MASRLLPPTSVPIHSAADTLQAIQRQTTYLQKEIQSLLDAQSIGLLAGLGQEIDLDNGSTYDARPALSTKSFTKEIPPSNNVAKSQTFKRRPSLSTSRNQLCSSLTQLAGLKDEEHAVVEVQCDSLNSFLINTTTLIEKKAEIELSIHGIDAQTEGAEKSLEEEEKSLALEAASLEKQLEEANTKLKHVRQQKGEYSNRRSARLSSWQGALEEVDRQITREVLEGRGLEHVIPDIRKNESKSKDIGIWNLSRDRRTVELIREDITGRIKTFEDIRDAAERESIACYEGAEMWTFSVKKIEDLERSLADEMDKLTSNDFLDPNEVNKSDGMIQIVIDMTKTIDHLEHKLDIAERNSWNLLVCMIGTEVEALRQGRDLLQETLQMTQAESTPGTLSMMTAKSRMTSDLMDGELENENITKFHGSSTKELMDGFRNDAQHELDLLEKHQQILVGRPKNVHHEDGDDSPNPKLLIEHND